MEPESELVALAGVAVRTEHLEVFGARPATLRPRSDVVAAHAEAKAPPIREIRGQNNASADPTPPRSPCPPRETSSSRGERRARRGGPVCGQCDSPSTCLQTGVNQWYSEVPCSQCCSLGVDGNSNVEVPVCTIEKRTISPHTSILIPTTTLK